MRAHQIMTRHLVTVSPKTSLRTAAEMMLANRISALPVVDDAGSLVGIVSEGDLLHRAETGTPRRPNRWLWLFLHQHEAAQRYVQEHGKAVSDVMARDVASVGGDASLDEVVSLMEQRRVKRIPVVENGKLVGMITRSDIVHAFLDNTDTAAIRSADDKQVQQKIYRELRDVDWRPLGLQVVVGKGDVHLRGMIVDEAARRACVVAAETAAGARRVHDHLMLIDGWSGFYTPSPEDIAASR